MPYPLLMPSLYAVIDGELVLLGGVCSCGCAFFPMQTFGCESCGKAGDSLQPKALRARGKLITTAVIHMHADKRRPAPFAVGTIKLDDGPVIRTLLADIVLTPKAVQQRVQAALAIITLEDESLALDLRFNLETKDTASEVER